MAPVGLIVGLPVITKLSALPLFAVLVVLAFMRGEWLKRAQAIFVRNCRFPP
jgi:hypothetical protein